jgi:hypothetical protein
VKVINLRGDLNEGSDGVVVVMEKGIHQERYIRVLLMG